jgi:hypothetical protein
MGHGFGGTMDCDLEHYAGRYREAGLAVLAFDYRHFGGSDTVRSSRAHLPACEGLHRHNAWPRVRWVFITR